MPEDYLEIRGARVHNLHSIDLRFPHNQLVVVTGVSGSGKSSLVFDIVYAEGRRRYVESLSSYARQFLERMEKPDVDEVLGIAPTVAIRQKNTTRNPRSTVATTTEIYDFLRLLFARVGRTHCTGCGRRVTRDGVDAVAREVLELEPESRWYVLFPVREQAESQPPAPQGAEAGPPSKRRLAELRARGYNRLYQNGRVFEFSTPESLLDIDFGQPLFVLLDRLAIAPGIRERVAEAVEIAYRESGEVLFEPARAAEGRLRFSSRFQCRDCGIVYEPPEPRMFSFNTPLGACPHCEGQGQVTEFDLGLIVNQPHLSLARGAVGAWEQTYTGYKRRMLLHARAAGVPTGVPYQDLEPAHRRWVEQGGDGFEGILGFLRKLQTKSYKPHIGAMLSRWRRRLACPECRGTRYSKKVLHIQVGGKSIAEVSALSLEQAQEFFAGLRLEGAEETIAANLLVEIRNRLRFLNEVGLQYLTLNRMTATLSGGEAQRIQLATSLGARLAGVCYVLDEPSIGLHNRDTARLIGILRELRDLGNTIIVVEHDREMMLAADHLVDLGPAAGERGGRVIFSGPSKAIHRRNGSLTGRYLRGAARIEVPRRRRAPNPSRILRFAGAALHNLRDVSVEIPLGLMTVVTGVSGSGKSTLVHGIVHRCVAHALSRRVYGDPPQMESLPCRKMSGHPAIQQAILVDQAALDRSPRSVPATYMKVFDEIRALFAGTQLARDRYYARGWFSFNITGGRCDLCEGSGRQTIDMQFLADIDLPCEECGGKRYRSALLEVRYRGKNIHEVLQLTVDEALQLFADRPKIVRRLQVLAEVGLGYIRLGQPGTQLSGGELQRMKLALHIADAQMRHTLFLFDEPTTGLHFDDIRTLLQVFAKLLENEASVLVIEHNLDVIKCADWIIDLGPEGGAGGGRIVAQGPPEHVAQCAASHTARFLRGALG